jgi:hypothetical protein
MKVVIRLRGTRMLPTLGLLVLVTSCASSELKSAALPKSAIVPWDALTDSDYLQGASEQSGDYVGKLVSLPCTPVRAETGTIQCDASGRRPGLVIPGDATVHVLVSGDPAVRQKLDSPQLQGKQVLVTGIRFASLKAIVVSGVDVQH